MRYLISVLVSVFLLAGCGQKEAQSVTFFTHEGCPYCEKALQYIHLNYPKLPMRVLEVTQPENMVNLMRCVQRFKLDSKKIGTPLICMDKHYIMGWSEEEQNLFNEYVKSYLPKK